MALAVLRVALLAGSAKHRAVADELPLDIELRWGGDAMPVSCGGIPHEELVTCAVEDEDAPVADAEQVPAVTLLVPQGEAMVRDVVGRVHDRAEDWVAGEIHEDAEEWGPPVTRAEAAEEAGVGDEAAPGRADRGGAGQG